MDRAEAIHILDPETTIEALTEIEYYHGFNGATAKVQAVSDACEVAVAIMREQEQSKWISVKDGYPKRMKRYFIAYQFEGSDMCFYGEAMFHPEGGNGCVDRPHFSNEGVDGMYVTHWMEIPKLPLPEPPKEGADHA